MPGVAKANSVWSLQRSEADWNFVTSTLPQLKVRGAGVANLRLGCDTGRQFALSEFIARRFTRLFDLIGPGELESLKDGNGNLTIIMQGLHDDTLRSLAELLTTGKTHLGPSCDLPQLLSLFKDHVASHLRDEILRTDHRPSNDRYERDGLEVPRENGPGRCPEGRTHGRGGQGGGGPVGRAKKRSSAQDIINRLVNPKPDKLARTEMDSLVRAEYNQDFDSGEEIEKPTWAPWVTLDQLRDELLRSDQTSQDRYEVDSPKVPRENGPSRYPKGRTHRSEEGGQMGRAKKRPSAARDATRRLVNPKPEKLARTEMDSLVREEYNQDFDSGEEIEKPTCAPENGDWEKEELPKPKREPKRIPIARRSRSKAEPKTGLVPLKPFPSHNKLEWAPYMQPVCLVERLPENLVAVTLGQNAKLPQKSPSGSPAMGRQLQVFSDESSCADDAHDQEPELVFSCPISHTKFSF